LPADPLPRSAPIQQAGAPDQPKQESGDPVRADRHGDPLPPGALARVGTTRLRHGDGIWDVAFSPDGTAIVSASGSFDPTVRFWDLASAKELRRLQVFPGFPRVNGGVLGMAFSPDGTQLATGTYSVGPNPIILWDARTGERLRPSLLGHSGGVLAVAYAPDGKMLASGSYDKTVRLWDLTRTGPCALTTSPQARSCGRST
jgi:WD40 repeat protein